MSGAPEADDNWYAVVDTAQDSRLFDLVQRTPGRVCLFAGKLHPVLAASSPWLVRMRPNDPLFETWKQEGRGRNWGIMCRTTQSLEQMRRHFRQFLQARLPDGQTVLFRFYDPRVFATYMRASTPGERAPWFEGVVSFAVEGAAPGETYNFHLRGDRLFDGDRPFDA